MDDVSGVNELYCAQDVVDDCHNMTLLQLKFVTLFNELINWCFAQLQNQEQMGEFTDINLLIAALHSILAYDEDIRR